MEYFYRIGTLKRIASNYRDIYEGINFNENSHVIDMQSIAEFKCDFENGLSFLGKKFRGLKSENFKNYQNYPDLQRVIIADIYFGSSWVANHELIRLKEGELIGIRHLAYKMMCDFLNGKRN